MQTQRNYRRVYQKDPSSKNSILRWKKNFLETGSIIDKCSGCLCTSDAECVRETFLLNLRGSVRSTATELNLPISAVYKVIKKRLRLFTYKVRIAQALELDDRPRRMAFATDMPRRIEDDAEFLNHIIFSDKACFHLFGTANFHMCTYGDLTPPYEYCELRRDSSKVIVWRGLMYDCIIGLSFLLKRHSYLLFALIYWKISYFHGL
ncbi:DUF4817 domain-containing protein [Nephila pilipes]|uniref:DUF4817 domain-containing protein n=1 Tax=Nephila pilipes TaxID=299642 RepID=A0A8X6R5R0_NEPPI|nr:DUF4817 domain-containing protein [Nephila pilipes]